MTRTTLAITKTRNSALKATTMFLLCLIINACATPPQLPINAAENTLRAYQDVVTFGGTISVQYQQNEQEQSLSGSYEWQQTAADMDITLSGPLGQTIAKIKQNAQGASLKQAKQETITAPTIEQLLAENLGWSLPANGLKTWIQGYDFKPSGERFGLSPQDNITITSQGWTLRFVKWQADEGQLRPKLIYLSRSTQELGDLKIRIAINERQ